MTQPAASSRSVAPRAWHPTDHLRTLYKRRWIAIPGFLLVFVSGTVNSIRTVPIYEARTQILIDKDSRRATSLTNVLQDQQSWYNDDFYPTQYKILQSRALAWRTVQALKGAGVIEKVPPAPKVTLTPGSLFNAALGAVTGLFSSDDRVEAISLDLSRGAETAFQSGRIDGFLGGLSVVPVRNSLLVDLKYQSPDRVYAARAVNALAEQYQAQTIENRFNASMATNQWLSDQLEQQRKVTQTSERALQEYKEQHNAVAVDDKQNIVIQKLTALNNELTRVRIDRMNKESAYNDIQVLKQNGQPLDAAPGVSTSEFVQKLRSDLGALQTQRAQLTGSGKGANHPAVQAIAGQIADVTAKLQVEVDKAVEGVASAFRTAKAAEESLTRALEAQKGEALGTDRQAMEYAALEREAAGNRELYENLLQRTKETGVSGEFRGSNVQIIDAAEVPQTPILPVVRRDLLTAAFGGILLAIALGFGVEYFDSRIKQPDEIKTHLGLPFLGMLPVVPGVRAGGEAPMLSPDVPPSFAEAVRAVRTAVLFSSAEPGSRSLIVTSTGPSEGKTLVSSSLAIALAQAGQRTIVVDADMRRPRMHEALGLSQEPGISNVLVGESPLTDAARQTTVENLWLVSAGHIPPNPAELLGSQRFEMLLVELRKRFDWVIIDAPPVMPVTDAAVLAHSCGSVLFVVGAEMTPRQTAAAAIEQLRGAGATFVGAVLNRVNITRHAYYYAPYYRKEYSKYYQRSPRQA